MRLKRRLLLTTTTTSPSNDSEQYPSLNPALGFPFHRMDLEKETAQRQPRVLDEREKKKKENAAWRKEHELIREEKKTLPPVRTAKRDGGISASAGRVLAKQRRKQILTPVGGEAAEYLFAL